MQNNNIYNKQILRFSKHAKIRGQQRAITKNVTDLVLFYGDTVEKPGEAIEVRISKKTIQQLFNELKRQQKLLEKATDIGVLISDNGEIITQYHLQD